MRKKQISLGFVMMLLLSLMPGCDTMSRITGAVNDSLTAVNQAIESLDNNSAAWQQILGTLQGQIDETLKQDVTTIIDRAVMSTGEQVNCLIDIRVQQIRKALLVLRAKITHETVPPVDPVICLVTPTSIQMSFLSGPNATRKFDISGYDMDKGDIKVRIERNNGNMVNLPASAFSRQSHYHATVDFSSMNMTTDMARFIVVNGTQRLTEVAILQKTCETKNYPTEGTFANPQTITISGFSKTAGDKDFGWNTAKVDVDVALRVSSDGNRVTGDFSAHANEDGGDHTAGDAGRTVTLFTNTNPNFKINRIVSPTNYSNDNFIDDKDEDFTRSVGGGLIESIVYHVRCDGNVDLDEGFVKFNVKTIKVELKERNGCVN